MVRGSCLCGTVSWEVAGSGDLMSHCHCSMCRKSHGSAYGTYLAFPADGFRWQSGPAQIVEYFSSPGFARPFCGVCGSVVAGEPRDDLVFMPAGCLDDDPGARAQAHIFVASKAPWWAITDDLPTFDMYPPGFDVPDFDREEPGAPTEGVTRGSCLCGDVGFEITGQHEAIFCCHCSRCRKARSAAHATNLFVPPEQFQWTSGEDGIASYKVPDAARFAQRFCRRCGAPMPRVGTDSVAVPVGCLDDDPGARPALHIHVASMAPWHTISDTLPRHPAGPDSPPA